MEITTLDIPGLALILPQRIGDERGSFAEIFRRDWFTQNFGDWTFVQENESHSRKVGTIRGLHFQTMPRSQGKLVRCAAGALFDVAVDIRNGSPTFGQWFGATLTAGDGKQIWMPPGFAHGFCTIEPDTVICYKVTDYYDREYDYGLAWDDPLIGISWPDVADPETLSSKDRNQPAFNQSLDYFSWSP